MSELVTALKEKKDARNNSSNWEGNWNAWYWKKKKKKLRFLICSNHFNDKICVKSSCEISDFLPICNIILLSDLTKESKISEFQNHCRKYYQNSLWLDYYLKGPAVLVKGKEDWFLLLNIYSFCKWNIHYWLLFDFCKYNVFDD